jgi:PAS domain S-box-containing protein
MAVKQSTLPDRSSTPDAGSLTAFDVAAVVPSARARVLSLVLRPSSPPLAVGVAVAVFFIVAETVVVYLLKQVAPTEHLAAIYLLGVLVVSTMWRLGLGVVTSVASAITFDCVRGWPTGQFFPIEAQNGVVHASLLLVALAANALAGLARARADEAEKRRCEADLAAELARLMLRTGDLDTALEIAARRLALVLQLPFAVLERGVVRPDEWRSAIVLRDGRTALGTLLVPSDLPRRTLQRLRERVVPSLEALLRAACEREVIGDALEASWQELERFFDVSSDLLCIGGPVYFKRINPAFERTLGYTRGELLSRPLLEYVLPQDRDRTREVFVELSRGDEPVRFENRFIRSDGTECWLEWSMMSHRGLFYAAGRDVTERRREQHRLREAQRIIEASNAKLAELAEQQAALRRMATLVAQGVAPSEVFSAVVEEMVRCLHVCGAVLLRYQPGGEAVVVAAKGEVGSDTMSACTRVGLDGASSAGQGMHNGCAAAADTQRDAADFPVPGVGASDQSGVGAPVVVDGGVWGAAIVDSSYPALLPADTNARVRDFADLVATAIANAAAREELTASRARIVAADDTARRRLERDLHDGAQQRLESLKLEVRMTEESVPPELDDLRQQISDIVVGLDGVSDDLHEFSRGIHPAVLASGLGAALHTLARRSAVQVALDVEVDQQLPESIEVAAYYVMAEALTNTAKYAQASEVHASVWVGDANLCLSIRDDGNGGADSRKGSGLIGLVDRVEAIGGRMQIVSPVGRGTSLRVTLPLRASSGVTSAIAGTSTRLSDSSGESVSPITPRSITA